MALLEVQTAELVAIYPYRKVAHQISLKTAERTMMPKSEEVRKAGQEIAASSFLLVADKLNAVIAQFVGGPCEAASAALIDADGNKTATFSSVIFAGDRMGRTANELVPADSAGAVIDVNETLDLSRVRSKHLDQNSGNICQDMTG